MSYRNKYLAAIMIMLTTALGACSEKEIMKTGHSEEGENIAFSFRVIMPELEQEAGITKSQTENETKVKSVDFLVFTKNTGDTEYKYSYHVKGSVKSSIHPMAGFEARLKSETLPVKIYIIANADMPTMLAEPSPGTTESAVKTGLYIPVTPGAIAITGIPMWGEHEFPAGIAKIYSREIGGIKMFRTLAKVTVTPDPAIGSRFVMTGLYIARARSRSAIVPGVLSSSGLITGVNVPSGATGLSPVSITPFTSPFYLPEDEGYATANELSTGQGSKNNTAIIVAGKLDGGPETFHRIDIRQDGYYGRITRNHHYKVSIKDLKGNGVASLNDALALLRPTMVYETKDYVLSEGMTAIVFDQIDQLSAAAKQIVLPSDAGTVDIPVNPGEVNSSIEIARFNAGNIVGSLGQTANLTDAGAEAQIVNSGGTFILRINSQENNATLDKTDNLILQSPSKTLILNIIKKSPTTSGISAVVQGSSNPQRAEFTSSGGEKTIQITSDTDWKTIAVPDWVKTEKMDNSTLKISIVGMQSDRAREHIFYIENSLGKRVAITVYQQYALEWSKAYLKGGQHTVKETIWKWIYSSPEVRYDMNVTPQDSPKEFAADAGDVFFIPGKVKNPDVLPAEANPYAPAPNALPAGCYTNDITNTNLYYLTKTTPANYNMQGDRYDLKEARTACPDGWRLPTYNEVQVLINNLQYGNEALYVEQNGERVYFPFVGIYFNGGDLFHIENYQESPICYLANVYPVAFSLKNNPRKMHINVRKYNKGQDSSFAIPVRCVR